MSKTVTIPAHTRPDWKCSINGKRYSYQAGSTQEVPDEIAALIEASEDMQPKHEADNAASCDWNQNDPSATDYVKNRTHWSEYTDVVCLAPTTHTFTRTSGWVSIMPTGFNIGDTLTVKWNGVEYNCIAKGVSVDEAYFGNNTLVGSDLYGEMVDTGEPFFFVLNVAMCYVYTSDLTTVTIEITAKAETVHKFDPKYMPDGHGETLVVTFDSAELPTSCDTAPFDIYTAFTSGRAVYGYSGYDQKVYRLVQIDKGRSVFVNEYYKQSTETVTRQFVTVTSDGVTSVNI